MLVPVKQRDAPWRLWKAAEAAVHAAAPRGTVDAREDAAYASCKGIKLSATQQRRHSDLIRDIFGNPFRRAKLGPLATAPGAPGPLARVIYDERAFDRLPLLADALEDAGCTDADLLGHLRLPGPHVRGCWAVDLVVGKQ
jgi:hypothetical protein